MWQEDRMKHQCARDRWRGAMAPLGIGCKFAYCKGWTVWAWPVYLQLGLLHVDGSSDFVLNMVPISAVLLLTMLNCLSGPELKDIYGMVALRMPWVLIELVIHALMIRRLMKYEVPVDGVSCIEFFSGSVASSQIAKAFTELGQRALAFDISRHLTPSTLWTAVFTPDGKNMSKHIWGMGARYVDFNMTWRKM